MCPVPNQRRIAALKLLQINDPEEMLLTRVEELAKNDPENRQKYFDAFIYLRDQPPLEILTNEEIQEAKEAAKIAEYEKAIERRKLTLHKAWKNGKFIDVWIDKNELFPGYCIWCEEKFEYKLMQKVARIYAWFAHRKFDLCLAHLWQFVTEYGETYVSVKGRVTTIPPSDRGDFWLCRNCLEKDDFGWKVLKKSRNWISGKCINCNCPLQEIAF